MILIAFSNAFAKGYHYFEPGISVYRFNYKEDLPSSIVSSEEGILPGISASYTYMGLDNPLYGRVLLEYVNFETESFTLKTVQNSSKISIFVYNFTEWED